MNKLAYRLLWALTAIYVILLSVKQGWISV